MGYYDFGDDFDDTPTADLNIVGLVQQRDRAEKHAAVASVLSFLALLAFAAMGLYAAQLRDRLAECAGHRTPHVQACGPEISAP